MKDLQNNQTDENLFLHFLTLYLGLHSKYNFLA
jgi:hypothetical protein